MLLEESKTYVPYFISLFTIISMTMIGNKDKNSWIVAILNQILWTYWIILTQAFGLLPMNIVLWFIYIRNHIKWNR